MAKIVSNLKDKLIHIQLSNSIPSVSIGELRVALDEYFNLKEEAVGLVIETAPVINHDNAGMLYEYLALVKTRQHLIRRVAIVGDELALKAYPLLTDSFVAAKLRNFPQGEKGAAVEWAVAENIPTDAFEVLSGFPKEVVACKANGTITSHDYLAILAPLVEERLLEHSEVKFYCLTGGDFGSTSSSTIWDDMRLGLDHLFSFSKIALVTDSGWLVEGAKLFGPLMQTELMVFPTIRDAAAREWIVN